MKLLLKILAFVMAAPLALLLIIFLVGLMLPRTHSVSRTALVHAAPDTVWAVITNWERSADWRSDVERVERLPDRNGHAVWKQIAKDGEWPLEIAEESAPSRLVTVVADSSQGFGGAWTYVLLPEGDGTRVTITEDGFVDNPAFRFLAKFVFGHTSTMEGYLKGLGTHFGESLAPAAPA